MESFQMLDEKTRRSHSLTPQESEECYLRYAKQCRDQLTVYDYMLDNGIGVNNLPLWIARAKYFEASRDLANVLRTLKQARQLPEIRAHLNYCLLSEYEDDLEMRLREMINIKTRGKRSVPHQYGSSSEDKKFYWKRGSMVVFVDRSCRENYSLEMTINQYLSKCPDDVQFEKGAFEAELARRPMSWISNRRNQLESMATENIHRVSGLPGASLRSSVNVPSQIQDNSRAQTPKRKLERLRERDSAELLRQSFLKRKSQLMKRQNESPHFSNGLGTASKLPSEKRSALGQRSMQKIRSECMANFPPVESVYSFGKPQRIFPATKLDVTFQHANDIARIENSDFISSEMEVRNEMILHNVIRESQIARYEPEVVDMTGISVIDSERENRGVVERAFQREQGRDRVPLGPLQLEEVIQPDLFGQVFLADVSPLSDDSLHSLAAMLDQEGTQQYDPASQHVRIDNLGFRRPSNPASGLTGLMSERKQRPSYLSEISEEIPLSDMKYSISNRRTS